MPAEQTLFFTCPHCEERFAQVEEPDKDIHTGEIYHCGNCGIQVIFQAVTVEDYVPPPRARRDCHFCQPEPCRFGPGSDQRGRHPERRDDMRLAAQAKGGYYPTPDRVVDLIADLIRTPTGYYYRDRETLRILDPCCGAGDALERLVECLSRPNALSMETFGIELHRDRAEEAERRVDHVLAADLFATSIANGAFGLLFLNPPYDYDSEDKRTEHAFLTQTTRYLADDGLLAFIVPRQRLAVSARYLSTHYGRMQCWAFPDPERQVFDQVALMGYRKADPVPDALAESRVLEWAVGEPEPLRSHSYTEFTPSTTPIGDILFATRTVDPVAAAAEARRSGLWASTEITDTLWPASDTRTRPLMPLRRGHIAMLLVAGFLDNLVLEADGRRILVKGRTSKEMVMVEDAPEKEVHRERLNTTVVALDLDDGEIDVLAS